MMKLRHSLSARQFARQSSLVVNGEAFMTWRLMLSIPSTPQSSVAVGETEVVDDEVVDVAGVTGSVVVTEALIPHSRL